MAPSKVVAVYPSIDWLTVTSSNRQTQQDMSLLFREVIGKLQPDGMESRRWGMHGYVGLKCGGIRWGVREDSSILMLSGQLAQFHFPALLAMRVRPTRVDLAVTVELATAWHDLIQSCYAHCLGLNLSSRKYCLITNTDNGATLYVGSRMSDQFGRFYDKAAEQGIKEDIGRLFRYEVEFKEDRAKAVASAILQRYGANDWLTLAQSISDTVWSWFNSREVYPLWDKGTDKMSLEVTAKISDHQTTLNWLSVQVAPSIARLARAGKRTQIIDALGLDDILGVDDGEGKKVTQELWEQLDRQAVLVREGAFDLDGSVS